MNLNPQDLRGQHHQKIVHKRANQGITTAPFVDHAPQLGRLGRYWSRGSGMDEAEAARVAPHVKPVADLVGMLGGLMGSLGSSLAAVLLHKKLGVPNEIAFPLFAAGTGLSVWLSAAPLPRIAFLQLHRPVRPSEIDPLIAEAEDDLDRTFLNLARDVLRQEIPERDQKAVREAVAALAQALDRLPEVHPSAVDPAALLAEADAIDRRSHEESDRLTSDSLQRQAAALRRRAAAADRSALSAKRVAALRGELKAQMEALREGIAAMATDTTEASAVHLAPLSEAVRQVAAEVVSTIDAKAEVEALTARASSASEESVQAVGRRL